jgi:GNAT superfamily N-acetyltransferase
MIEIRKGIEQDVERIMELGNAYYNESAFSSMEFNESKCRDLFFHLLQYGFAVVADDGGKLVGMMGAILNKHFFTDTLMAQDVLVYVSPEYRCQGLSRRLITVYINWAISQGVKRDNIFLGVDSGINRSITEEVYNNLGFKRFGTSMRLQEV